jgi:predicted outer membrane repeat protein
MRLGFGVAALALSTSAVLAPVAAFAATVHTVGTSGDFTTIQEALDAAGRGDVIVVVDATTYNECLTVPPSADLTLVGSSFPGDTVTVNCSSVGSPTVDVDSAILRVRGISFTHSNGRAFDGNGATLDLSGVSIKGTTARTGGAILMSGGTLTLSNSVIDGASATEAGGAIYASGASVTVRTSTLQNNSAPVGGAVWVDAGSLALAHATFSSNNASTSAGGAIYKSGTGSLTLESTTFDKNVAIGQGGAIYMTGGTGHKFERATFTLNEADEGGALLTTLADLSVSFSTFSENTATTGGAWYQASNTAVGVANTYSLNEAVGNGGGVYSLGTYTSRDELFEANLADNGAGLYNGAGGLWVYGTEFEGNEAAGQGGGVNDQSGQIQANHATFDANTAKSGAGLFVRGETGFYANLYGTVGSNNVASGDGGAIHFDTGARARIYGANLESNTADRGGGLYVGGRTYDFYVYDSLIQANTARLGGGIASDGGSLDGSTYYVRVQHTEVTGNIATEDGGGYYLEDNGSLIDNSWFHANAAGKAGAGGGLASVRNTYLVVRGTNFCRNTAYRHAGAYVTDGWGYRDFTSNVFMENSAAQEGGAFSSDTFNTYSGSYNYAYLQYNTVIGNRSTGTVHDGIYLNNSISSPTYQYQYYNIYFDNADSGTSQATSASTYQIVQWGVFNRHTTDILNNPSYRIGTGGNVNAAPSFLSYSVGDCFNDDLTSTSYSAYGAHSLSLFNSVRMYQDVDGDGYSVAERDCDDRNSARHPARTEVIGDGVDQNCAGWDDQDGDDDGFLAAANGGVDCDDKNAAVYPGAAETWYDGRDSDCSGGGDVDQDRDGTPTSKDCDDTDPDRYPGAPELSFDGVDNDCDKLDQDEDADGFMAEVKNASGVLLADPVTLGLRVDCDGSRGDVFPGAREVWYDGIDADCSGGSDFDRDSDGDDSNAHGGGDCNEDNPLVNSKVAEIWYDGFDQNCDGADDYDQDGDGDKRRGSGGGDCVDTDDAIFTGAPDIKDDLDNDCDAVTDRDTDQDNVLDWYEIEQGTDTRATDTDGDTIPDGIEWGDTTTHAGLLAVSDADGDGKIDALDDDSDGDGIKDRDEAGVTPRNPADTDGDGLYDFRDDDDDGDGISTRAETEGGRRDTDGDGQEDHVDPDADGDGAFDKTEGTADSDGDGVANYLDAGGDADTWRDPAPPERYGFGLGCSAVAGGSAPVGALGLLLGLIALGVRRRR